MLSQTEVLWSIGYPLYAYGSIFVIILIVWHVTRSYHGVRHEPKKRCCRHHRKVRQRARASRARRFAQGEAEKPQKLLSVMKSQGWLPQEKSVRKLLCADPHCKICNTVALEIQELLKADTNQLSTTLLGSSDIKMLPRSNMSFEQNLELHSQNSGDISLATVTPRQTELTEHLAQPTNVVSIQEYWADHLQLVQDIQLPETSLDSEMVASSRLEGTMITVNEQEITANCAQGDKQHYHLKAQDSFLPLNSKITKQTHPTALHIGLFLPTHLAFLCPEVLRLLEVHVKKWIHFQKWGLPRRVENSLRELMPDPTLFCLSRKNLQTCSFPSSTSKVTAHIIGTIPYQSWHSCLAYQHTQSLWVSEWSATSLGKRVQQNQNCKVHPLPCRAMAVISGHRPLPKRQTNDSRSSVWQRYHQLFCGLPSLHSESLVAIFLGPQRLSKNMSKLSLKDLHLFKDLSYLPLLSQPGLVLAQVTPSPPCPNGEYPTQHQEALITVPILSLAECEALEWHLLQRQLQLQWGLPAAFHRSQHAQSPMQCELRNEVQSCEIVKASWSGKPFSILTRELHFFPEHAHKLLGFHLQKHLMHLRWGLPEKIQKSIQLLLSSTGQQPLSLSNKALPNMSISQPGPPEAKGDGCLFSPMISQVSVPMPHFFVQAQAMLQSHIDSKCGQIHQGKVPDLVYSSWECRIPGVLAMAPFTDMLQGQPLELQAASEPDLYHKVTPCKPVALGQQQQALSNTTTKYHPLLQTLPEETIEKLETTLRHKYLAFLSGLPVVYYVSLSKVKCPATTSQPIITDMVPMPIKIPPEPLAQMHSLEASGKRSGPYFQDDKPRKDTAEKSQPELQVEANTKTWSPKGKIYSAGSSFKVHMLANLNFHLKKKVLEIRLGIPEGARKSRKPNVAVPENKSTQEYLQSKQHQGNAVLQELPTPLCSPPAPVSEWHHPKEKQATELDAMQHNQKHPGLKAVPPSCVPSVSKIPQPYEDMTEAQVFCVQVQTNVSHPSLEKPRNPEPQRPGRSKASAHLPMLARKREDHPEKLEAAGDFGGRDAGFEDRPHAEVQRPMGILLNKTPQGSWRWKYGFHPVKPCQQNSQAKLPKPLSGVPRRRESEPDLLHRQTKPNGILSPERTPNTAQPVAAHAPQGQPFLDQPTRDQLLQSPACKGQVLKGLMRPAPAHRETRLADTGLRSKTQSFLYCVSPEMKGKGHLESTFSTAGKEAKPRMENVLSSLVHASSPMKRTETKKPMEHPKVQPDPTESPVGTASFLAGPPSPGNKLRLRSRQGSASVLGQPLHCPPHCPLVPK
ncbi:protein SPATA31F1 [Dipodomys merriami]|uniref:protein SPATA31F1 n=1 Tax=Dipodomys merriami TaxID=94247 RepID=UPI00384D4602